MNWIDLNDGVLLLPQGEDLVKIGEDKIINQMADTKMDENRIICWLGLRKLENQPLPLILQAQRILMRNFLKDAPFQYHTFEEIVIGSSLEKRHEMKRIIEGIKQEKYDAIVVKDISRLSRGSQKDAGILYELLTQNEILIITPDRVINCTDENDLRMLRMELFLFHEEWKIIRGRMVSGRKAAAERGFFIGGPIPYGFQLDSKLKHLYLKKEKKKL